MQTIRHYLYENQYNTRRTLEDLEKQCISLCAEVGDTYTVKKTGMGPARMFPTYIIDIALFGDLDEENMARVKEYLGAMKTLNGGDK